MAEFLPGNTGQRIGDLRERKGLTQEELATKIGINATTLGRFENGQTQKISDEALAALSRELNVSADFLLGLTNIPDRKNYDIGELGLSSQAARNLYTRKVNTDVVNRLLENPRFATMTAMIAQYFDDTLAAGIAAQNQLFRSISDMLLGIGLKNPELHKVTADVAQIANLSQTPPYQTDMTTIQNTFEMVLKDIKRDIGSNIETSKAMTKQIFDDMVAELTKGQDSARLSITPEQMVDAIVHRIDDVVFNPSTLTDFKAGMRSLFEGLQRNGK